MPVVTSSDNWPVDSQETRRKRGPLVKVEIRPGQFVKMYKEDAIREGHMEPDKKKKQPPKDKLRKPKRDKAAAEEKEEEPEPDDFTVISGVGPATARALVAHGIVTLEQLRTAGELTYLNEGINRSIEEWRASGGA
jgi:predicted flap endonuclease-1-like 5' DNA nuclease